MTKEKPIYNLMSAGVFFGVMLLLAFNCRKEDSPSETTTPAGVRLSNTYEIREGDSTYRIRYTIDSAWYDPAYNPEIDR